MIWYDPMSSFSCFIFFKVSTSWLRLPFACVRLRMRLCASSRLPRSLLRRDSRSHGNRMKIIENH